MVSSNIIIQFISKKFLINKLYFIIISKRQICNFLSDIYKLGLGKNTHFNKHFFC